MHRFGRVALAVVAGLALAACRSADTGTTGSLTAYAAAPDPQAATDGLAGTVIDLGLSAKDQRMALAAEQKALDYGAIGAPVAWRGHSSSGQVVAGPLYKVNDYECREFTHTITIKGQSETATGTACRGADGTWQPVA